MNFSDIIALAKAGYSVSDVKELMSLDKNDETVPPENKTIPGTDGKDEADNKDKPEEKKSEQEQEPAIDYKLMYEESQKQLKDLQKQNTKTPADETKNTTADDILDDLFN